MDGAECSLFRQNLWWRKEFACLPKIREMDNFLRSFESSLHQNTTLPTLHQNTTLPTLHQNTTLVVGIDGQRVSFNDVLVTVPNLYIDGSCAVHGVDGSLVPIPSLLADSMKPRTQALPSQVAPKKHQTRQMFSYIRFIRRANRPNFSDEESETSHP
ncbi:hypothetical protein OIU74_002242 [Salix koriyanagi]|uniref:Uncharacterized protein n=1 Tax=Salix koriyanagi TaxID=2511006 RepID=A0A9Q1ANZ7_9ROSI|nr:hypothetical protein OIU74_002242 [Salix koriyanagi]